MRQFIVNKYITLKLKHKKTVIYVCKKRFLSCNYLLLNSSLKGNGQYNSVDEIKETLNDDLHENISPQQIGISPREEFRAHCSNIHAWSLFGYDSRLLHSNLAFPLLEKLYDSGDVRAKKMFVKEVKKRFKSSYYPVQDYLISNGFLNYLSENEQNSLMKFIHDPRSIVSYLGILEGYRCYEASIKYGKLALLIDPINKEAHLAILKGFYILNDEEEINKWISKILKKFPTSWRTLEEMLLICLEVGRKQQREYMFKQLLKIVFENSEIDSISCFTDKLDCLNDPDKISLYKLLLENHS